MKLSLGRATAAFLCVLVLGACQPSLKSSLPTGTSAYETIAPAAMASAPLGPYLLRNGDRVAVNVFQEPELSVADVPVDESGMISLPLIGQIVAAGRTGPDLAAEIQRIYGARYLRDPQVNVLVRDTRPRTIAIEGQVVRPGVFPVEPGYTLLTAMALAGSPAPDARLDEVLVFRTVNGQRLGGRFDLTEIRSGRLGDPQLMAGDVVVVGYSSVRGMYRDILQAAPLLGVFSAF